MSQQAIEKLEELAKSCKDETTKTLLLVLIEEFNSQNSSVRGY